MKALMFVKTKEGKFLFKGDSFWSKGSEPDYAKVYSNDNIDEVNKWLKNGIFPWNIYKDKVDMVIDRYHDAVLGYFTPDESKFESVHNIKKGTTIEELGEPTYLWVIKLHPQSEWVINKTDEKSITPDTKSMGYFENYTEYHRDKVLDVVLNKKDSV